MDKRAARHLERAHILHLQSKRRNGFGGVNRTDLVMWEVNGQTAEVEWSTIVSLLQETAKTNVSIFFRCVCWFDEEWKLWHKHLMYLLCGGYPYVKANVPENLKELCKEVWNLAMNLQRVVGTQSGAVPPVRNDPTPRFQYGPYTLQLEPVLKRIERYWGALRIDNNDDNNNDNAHLYLRLMREINSIVDRLTSEDLEKIDSFTLHQLGKTHETILKPQYKYLEMFLNGTNTSQVQVKSEQKAPLVQVKSERKNHKRKVGKYDGVEDITAQKAQAKYDDVEDVSDKFKKQMARQEKTERKEIQTIAEEPQQGRWQNAVVIED